jgi:hypothetical protein
MKLERGIQIAGIVRDDAEQPIPDATLSLDGTSNDPHRPENVQFGPDTEILTDSEGRWSCNMVPKDLDEISVTATHPNYAETTVKLRPSAPEAAKILITMGAGFMVAGNVQDSDGHPVPAAQIRGVRLNSERELSRATDASGSFEISGVNAGELVLAVQADGLAPASKILQVTGNIAAVRFVLGPGQLLRGRLTDEEGHPVPNAWAEITRKGFDKVTWSGTTDADGRFEWDSAPSEPLLYSFLAEGFKRVYALELRADGSEHVIKLSRELPGQDSIQIGGTVVDADSGSPLDDFEVEQGAFNLDHPTLFRFAAEGKEGDFAFTRRLGSKESSYQLQILKDGYVPVLSTNFTSKAGNQKLAFQLKRSLGPSGLVLLPSGQPADHATVCLCTPQAGVYLDGPAHVRNGLNTTVHQAVTDEAGRFSLPAVASPQGLIVVHDLGYAELSPVPSTTNATITLQPWGQITGSLIINSRSCAEETIVASGQVYRFDELGRPFGFVTFHLETKTDTAGRFVFQKVPTGDCEVSWMKKSPRERRSLFFSHGITVGVHAGATTQATLGGGARSIFGNARLADDDAPVDWLGVPVLLTSKTDGTLGSYPKRSDFSNRDAFISAINQWRTIERAVRRFAVFCAGDGTFQFPDIPPGTYDVEIRLRDLKPDSVSSKELPDERPEIGSVVQEITVPGIADGQSAQPLELGAVELQRSR